jgi:hypothetical protein
MTSSNANQGDRLNRIEAIVESNSRAIQAMMEQRATDRLEHEERMNRLEDLVARLTRIEEAQNRMLASMDDERPTVLRRLMAIENKVDTLIERNQ